MVIRNRRGYAVFRKMTPPVPVAQEDMDKNLAKVTRKHPRCIEMLDEMQRLPWLRYKLNDLKKYASVKGKLTEGQRGFITSLYIDCCVISDADVKRQVETRKLILRLMILCNKGKLGQVGDFISSVSSRSDKYRFSPAQMRAVENVAKRMTKALAEVPMFTDATFDGWFTTNTSWSDLKYVDNAKE